MVIPMGELAEKVPLYTCKICSVRMFEHDTGGHLLRHGKDVNNPLSFFFRGDADHFGRPGERNKVMHVPNKRKKKAVEPPRKRKAKSIEETDITLN